MKYLNYQRPYIRVTNEIYLAPPPHKYIGLVTDRLSLSKIPAQEYGLNEN